MAELTALESMCVCWGWGVPWSLEATVRDRASNNIPVFGIIENLTKTLPMDGMNFYKERKIKHEIKEKEKGSYTKKLAHRSSTDAPSLQQEGGPQYSYWLKHSAHSAQGHKMTNHLMQEIQHRTEPVSSPSCTDSKMTPTTVRPNWIQHKIKICTASCNMLLKPKLWKWQMHTKSPLRTIWDFRTASVRYKEKVPSSSSNLRRLSWLLPCI